MELNEVVKQLNLFAPTSLAEKWDNVGLLIEPSSPHQVHVHQDKNTYWQIRQIAHFPFDMCR